MPGGQTEYVNTAILVENDVVPLGMMYIIRLTAKVHWLTLARLVVPLHVVGFRKGICYVKQLLHSF